MYQENGGGFDQSSSSLHENGGVVLTTQAEDAFSQTHLPNCNNFSSMEEQSYPHTAAALEMELHHHLQNGADIQEMVHDSSNWQEMACFNGENGTHYHHPSHNPAADFNQIYDAAPDLLNMFPLPRCSMSSSSLLPNSSITFSHSSQKSPAFMASLGLLGDVNVNHDPLLPLNLPPQPPLLRELFHSLPQGGGVYSLGGSRNGSLFTNGVDERENAGLYQNGDGVFEFTAADLGKNPDGSKETKHFATERHRRVLLNNKYQDLRALVPSPTKNDRASIVGDAINYINELKRTVTELKGLVEKRRCAREMLKRPKIEENGAVEGNESKCVGDTLRSSWLHRKTKNTEVDVRIIDDEVTVKMVQQKRINCLLFVSRVLDELQLDLHHVAGGLIGDYYSYLFNSKICEGSIVYASAVADKLIDVVDKQYAAVPPSSY